MFPFSILIAIIRKHFFAVDNFMLNSHNLPIVVF
nr:MAG TPA: hypothetical protein [Caudoviricetes sp.]DAH08300.1 MAG TPA: hypothetical protein [Caudoviricetes sp.]